MKTRQPPANQEHGAILLYQADDGRTKIEVRMAGETVWLSIHQMAELFQRDRSVISKHITNVYEEGELRQDQTCAKLAQVQREGAKEVERQIDYFNLDVIIAVGYRVKSQRGTQFRIWATERDHQRDEAPQGCAPDSIALEEEVIEELKTIAQEKGIPYQVLMRLLITDEIRRFKKAA